MVFEVADQLTAKGEKVTNRAIWTAIGGGSMTTISQALRRWKENQVLQVAQPIERTPLPASLIDVVHHAAAQLWDAALSETKAELDQLAQATNARVSEAQSERDDTLTELQATAEELEQVKLERDAARAESDNKAQQLTAATAEIARLQTELNAQILETTKANHRAETAEASRAELHARVGQLTQLLTDEQTTRKQAETDTNTLRAEVTRLNAEQTANDRRTAEIEVRAAAQQQASADEITQLKAERTELQALLKSLVGSISGTKENNPVPTTPEHSTRLEELRAEINKGTNSGVSTPLNIEDIKASGRQRLSASGQDAKDAAPISLDPEAVDEDLAMVFSCYNSTEAFFKETLEKVNIATLRAVLTDGSPLTKVKRTKIEAELRKRESTNEY
jgi:hypothetical protein